MSLEIAILGAGNGGQTMAADLTLAGHKVNLFELPAFAHHLEPVQAAGGLTLTGVGRNGFARLNKVTSDAKEAVENADLIMVVSAQPGHEAMVKAASPYMRDGQVMVFNTGYWSALRFQDHFKQLGKQVILAETTILVYLCSIKDPAHVHMDGIKANVPMAAFPGNQSSKVLALLSQAYDNFTLASSILETNLVNVNWIFHPAIVLGNLALIERTKGDFAFYGEGVTPAVARLVQEVDEERRCVAKAYGLNLDPAWVWLQKAYGARGDNIYDAIHTTQAYIPSRYTHVFQDLMHANFVVEDVPYGLVPIISLAEIAKVPTPTIRSVIQLLAVVSGRNFERDGLTMEKLGLGNLSKEELARVYIQGKPG